MIRLVPLTLSLALACAGIAHADSADVRMEEDLLGEKAIPADAYYGVQTARALENFHITGVPPWASMTERARSPVASTKAGQ